MAIAPPTITAVIGTSSPPRLVIDSIILIAASKFSGGADRDRTGGLLVANQALSQLSYSPNFAISFQPSALRNNCELRANG